MFNEGEVHSGRADGGEQRYERERETDFEIKDSVRVHERKIFPSETENLR